MQSNEMGLQTKSSQENVSLIIEGNEVLLPSHLKAMFREDIPIPGNVRFIADQDISSAILFGAGMLILSGLALVIALLIGEMLIKLINSDNFILWKILVAGIFIAVCAAVVLLIRNGMGRFSTRNAIAENSWRYGLFLTADAFIYREKTRCTVIPRNLMLACITEGVQGWKINHQIPAILYRPEQGSKQVNMFNLERQFQITGLQIIEVVEKWILAGRRKHT